MTVQEFATQYNLRLKRDSCGELFIPGRRKRSDSKWPEEKHVAHLYEYSGDKVGLVLLSNSVRKWNNLRRNLLALGFTLLQNGDTEGTLLFPAADQGMAKIAIHAIGAHPRRKASPAQLEILRKARSVAQTPIRNAFQSAKRVLSVRTRVGTTPRLQTRRNGASRGIGCAPGGQ